MPGAGRGWGQLGRRTERKEGGGGCRQVAVGADTVRNAEKLTRWIMHVKQTLKEEKKEEEEVSFFFFFFLSPLHAKIMGMVR